MFEKQHIAVLGLGIAGCHSVKTLETLGAYVYAWDDNETARVKAHAQGIALMDVSDFDFSTCDFLVASPGIPDTNPIIVHARAMGCRVIGEVKLRHMLSPDATYVGITGTNGKSTTVALVAHVLETLGMRCAVGGNFGTPAVALPDLGRGDVYVLEMSSYMLTRIQGMVFDVGCFLNFTTDHLEWHGNIQRYFDAKMHIFAGMGVYNTAIIGMQGTWGEQAVKRLNETGITPLYANYNDFCETEILRGDHNRQNISACVAICESLGLPRTDILNAIDGFQGLAHRQQRIHKTHRVHCVNDSKATNVDSTIRALACYDSIYWIAGGQEKDGTYDALVPYVSRIKHAYLIGQGAENIGIFLQSHDVAYTMCGTMDVAVKTALDALDVGVLLLSPACASWDQFDNFAHRGDVFTACVKRYYGGAI